MSKRAHRVLAGALSSVAVVLLVVGIAVPAPAHNPLIEASSWCDSDGQPWIDYRAWSWMQDPDDDGRSGNPDIGIYVNGVQVAQGAFTSENGYEFSGSIPATEWAGEVVTVRAQADAPFNNGSSLGSFRETTVDVPADCLPAEPAPVVVSVVPGACVFDDGVSSTPVSVSVEPPQGAVVTIHDWADRVVGELSGPGTLELEPGSYSWSAIAGEGFVVSGVGSGEFTTLSCEPTREDTDLAVEKSGPDQSVPRGSRIVYRITVSNLGPLDDPAAVLVDQLPASFAFVSASTSQGVCSNDSGRVTCDLGLLEAGSQVVVLMTVEPQDFGTFSNTAIISGVVTDRDLTNNEAIEDTTVVAVLPTTVTTSSTTSTSTTVGSSASSTTVTSPASSTTATSTTATSTASTSTASTSSTASADGDTTESLPYTGAGGESEAGIGAALIMLGGLVVLVAGRRHEQPAPVWIGKTWSTRRPRNTVNLMRGGIDID